MVTDTQQSPTACRAFLLTSLLVLLTGCFPLPVDVPSSPRTLDARTLGGDWYVAATNFPMWLDGGRCHPRFRYSNFADVDGDITMDDEVSYLEPGERERGTITGFDTQDASKLAHFTWRGDGLLALFTSEWTVAHMSPDGSFAIIFFTETPATPSGVDVITRDAHPSPDIMRAATKVLQGDAFLRQHARGLVQLRPAGPGAPESCSAPDGAQSRAPLASPE